MQQNSSSEKLNSNALSSDISEELVLKINALSEKSAEKVLRSEALALVRELWPAAFRVSSPKPLKIGIHKDMQRKNLIPDHIIEMAIKYFVSRDRYLECTREGYYRIDLEGKCSGRVNLKEAMRADMILYSRYQRQVRHTLSDNPIFLGKMRLVSITKQVALESKAEQVEGTQVVSGEKIKNEDPIEIDVSTESE